MSVSDWEEAYQNIKYIAAHFPTQLVRVASHGDYEKKLDTMHFDLVVGTDTPDEHISFWGDWMSYSGNQTVKFYKDWAKQQEFQSYGEELDETKPVTWYPDIPYINDGDIPRCNGILPFSFSMIDVEGAHYQSALIAIGVLLENKFPEGAFLTVLRGALHPFENKGSGLYSTS